uniref:Uncharacterized protein n=1 Tax=Anguilla anguilla TaxID=7936 RepID=A0A0E9PFI0_ANGAN
MLALQRMTAQGEVILCRSVLPLVWTQPILALNIFKAASLLPGANHCSWSDTHHRTLVPV